MPERPTNRRPVAVGVALIVLALVLLGTAIYLSATKGDGEAPTPAASPTAQTPAEAAPALPADATQAKEPVSGDDLTGAAKIGAGYVTAMYTYTPGQSRASAEETAKRISTEQHQADAIANLTQGFPLNEGAQSAPVTTRASLSAPQVLLVTPTSTILKWSVMQKWEQQGKTGQAPFIAQVTLVKQSGTWLVDSVTNGEGDAGDTP